MSQRQSITLVCQQCGTPYIRKHYAPSMAHLYKYCSRACSSLAQAGDLSGQRFGMLTVLRRGPNKVRGETSESGWVCRCDCGGENHVAKSDLIRGKVRSCRCIMGKNHTHGMFGTRVYKVWVGMIQRCHNPKDRGWRNWGGRGIVVCERWRHSFENFYSDMGAPAPGLSLDRIDNDGNYEPGNCRWVTAKEQQRNRRGNVFVDLRGEKKPVSAWAEEFGMDAELVRGRLYRGWDVERALTTPPDPRFSKRSVHSD